MSQCALHTVISLIFIISLIFVVAVTFVIFAMPVRCVGTSLINQGKLDSTILGNRVKAWMTSTSNRCAQSGLSNQNPKCRYCYAHNVNVMVYYQWMNFTYFCMNFTYLRCQNGKAPGRMLTIQFKSYSNYYQIFKRKS